MALVSACMTVDISVNAAYLLVTFHYKETLDGLSATAKDTQLNKECFLLYFCKICILDELSLKVCNTCK
jgi:hypothetical protein